MTCLALDIFLLVTKLHLVTGLSEKLCFGEVARKFARSRAENQEKRSFEDTCVAKYNLATSRKEGGAGGSMPGGMM